MSRTESLSSAKRAVRTTPAAEAWRRFRRHRLAVVGLVLLSSIVLAVIIGPFLWTTRFNEIDFFATMKGPSLAHPFGTDDLGQDILAGVLYGGRISLAVGIAAMLVALTLGTLIGAIAGMSRGPVDTVLMWVTDLFLSLPHTDIDSSKDDLKALADQVAAKNLVVGSLVAPVWPPTFSRPMR